MPADDAHVEGAFALGALHAQHPVGREKRPALALATARRFAAQPDLRVSAGCPLSGAISIWPASSAVRLAALPARRAEAIDVYGWLGSSHFAPSTGRTSSPPAATAHARVMRMLLGPAQLLNG